MKSVLIFTLLFAMLVSLTLGQQFQPKRQQKSIPRDVEKIYIKGLKYLAKKQSKDGSWGTSSSGSYTGVVGLAVLAFLAHGDDPNNGPYAKNIKKGIDFLIKSQLKNGFLNGNKQRSHPNMYNHGFATLALAEAYGMVEDKRLEKALSKAVNLILTSQKKNPYGAWRYSPTAKDADTTVSGCQIKALYAARNAGIPVPDEAFLKALRYMESCRNKSTGAYGYTSGNSTRITLTAIGHLCQSFARKHKEKNYQTTFNYLKKNLNYRDSQYPFYFEYYMSQALFQADEETWKRWNKKNIQWLKNLQRPDGSFTGNHGEVFSTSAALLSLALNYRFLPIYEK